MRSERQKVASTVPTRAARSVAGLAVHLVDCLVEHSVAHSADHWGRYLVDRTGQKRAGRLVRLTVAPWELLKGGSSADNSVALLVACWDLTRADHSVVQMGVHWVVSKAAH